MFSSFAESGFIFMRSNVVFLAGILGLICWCRWYINWKDQPDAGRWRTGL